MARFGQMARLKSTEGVGWEGGGRIAPAVAVVAIAVTAVFLRVRHLAWGLADGQFFPDEIIWVTRARAFVPLSWHSFAVDFSLTYPALYGYLVGLATALAHAVGATRPPPEFFLDIVLIARLLSALLGVVDVALVGLVATRMYSPRIGLAAAALMAVLPLEAIQVHYASVDLLLMTCFTLTLLACHALALRGTVPRAALAGAGAGLAFATKQTGLAALALAGLPLFERMRRERSPVRIGLLVATVLGGFAAAVLVACPPCVLEASTMLTAMGWLHSLVASGHFLNNRVVPSLGWYGRPYLYELVASLPYALGWPLYALALVGVVVALWRHELADRVLLGALIPYFLVIGGSSTTFPRYLMPLFPGLVILAARAIVGFSRWSRARAAVLAGVLGYSLVFAASQIETISFAQQKEVAEWIATVRPPPTAGARGTRVAYPKTLGAYFALAGFLRRAGLTPLAADDGHWFDDEADAFVLPEWLEIAIRREPPDNPMARDLDRLTSGQAGYREGARWTTRYFQRSFYASLDPGLLPGLGSYGFTVYLRGSPKNG